MNYGDKLREIQEIYNEAGVEPSSRYSPDELISEKEKIQGMLKSLQAKICLAIDAGEVPNIKMNDYYERSWLLNAEQGKGLFAKLWEKELAWWKSEGLDIKLKKAHDGGMREWLEIEVTPSEPAPSSGMRR